jgi:preprotein translocase subunit SecE
MASTDVETVHSGADKAKLALAAILAAGAFVAYFMLESSGAWAQWAAFVVVLLVAAVVFLVSLPGRQLVGFGRDSWREVQKVVWPARREAIQMTAYVFAFVFVMALFLWLTDKTLEWVLFDLFLGWR